MTPRPHPSMRRTGDQLRDAVASQEARTNFDLAMAGFDEACDLLIAECTLSDILTASAAQQVRAKLHEARLILNQSMDDLERAYLRGEIG